MKEVVPPSERGFVTRADFPRIDDKFSRDKYWAMGRFAMIGMLTAGVWGFLSFDVVAEERSRPIPPRDVEKWVAVDLPSTEKERWDFFMKANHSEEEWEVASMKGKVEAFARKGWFPASEEIPTFDATVHMKPFAEPVSPACTLKVEDGWIVAYNEGEWGGMIYWMSPDGSRRKRISDGAGDDFLEVNQFLVDGTRILGAACAGIFEGSIIEVFKEGKSWKVREILRLPADARAIVKWGADQYLVATETGLLRIDSLNRIHTLIADDKWVLISPNALAVDGKGNAYIAMRQFVVRCHLGSPATSLEFLVPGKSWLNTKTE